MEDGRVDITDPITVAAVLVRDHLDTLVSRHEVWAKSKAPRTVAESTAVLRIARALLEHIPGEARQARADRKEP